MEGLLVFLAIAGMIAFMGVMIYWSHVVQKKRTAGFEEQAQQLGLHFVDDPASQAYSQFDGFKLFNRGRSRKIRNLIEGDSGDVKISIFDYSFMTGSGKNKRSHNQTVIALQSHLLNCPEFSMRPEGFLDKIGGALGFQDINFDTHPEFSKLFVLKGPDETAIRSYFAPTVLEYFEGHAGNSLEGSGQTMFFYRSSVCRKPEELKDMLSEAYEAYGVLTDANLG